jgi:hypothetical protein
MLVVPFDFELGGCAIQSCGNYRQLRVLPQWHPGHWQEHVAPCHKQHLRGLPQDHRLVSGNVQSCGYDWHLLKLPQRNQGNWQVGQACRHYCRMQQLSQDQRLVASDLQPRRRQRYLRLLP